MPELSPWSETESCRLRLSCYGCMGTEGTSIHWRKVTGLYYTLPPLGTCPHGRTWGEIVVEREARMAAMPQKIAEAVDTHWDAALRRLRKLLSDTEFAEMLAELRDGGALHVESGVATEAAEEIARRRGLDLSQPVNP